MKDTNPSATISPFLCDHLIGQCAKEKAEEIQIPLETACFASLIAASHAVGSAYTVCYPNGDPLPVSLYGIAEQPSGTGKSRLVNDLYRGYIENGAILNKEIQQERKKVESSIKTKVRAGEEPHPNEQALLDGLKDIPRGTTDATPQSLEKVMARYDGFFMVYGTEQNLTRTLLGGLYSEGVTVDGIINSAFNGEYSSTERASSDRVTFQGRPYGGIFCLSQEGTIQTVLESAGTSGLAERFLMIREDDLLGERDKYKDVDAAELNAFITGVGPAPKMLLTKAKKVLPMTAYAAYKSRMSRLAYERSLLDSVDIEGLKKLSFTDEAWAIIEAAKSIFERSISNQKTRNSFLSSMNSKIDILVMKAAATIHVMDTADYQCVGDIQPDTVRTAFATVNSLFEGVAKISTENNLFGDNPEEQAIYDFLQQQRKPVSFDKVYMSLKRRKDSPFKFYQKRGEAKEMMEQAMKRLSEQGRLYQTGGKTPLFSVN